MCQRAPPFARPAQVQVALSRVLVSMQRSRSLLECCFARVAEAMGPLEGAHSSAEGAWLGAPETPSSGTQKVAVPLGIPDRKVRTPACPRVLSLG
jgi:hypothetical protein